MLMVVLPFLSLVQLEGQKGISFHGKVVDENGAGLLGASILITPGNYHTITDTAGVFIVRNIPQGKYIVEIAYIGYDRFKDTITARSDIFRTFRLNPATESLAEVVITSRYADIRKQQEPLNLETVNQQYIRRNIGGSLMESLQRLPGVTSIEIGSGQSKPVIRGLGFNRVVVMEDDIKHEAQQWGEDHGLETDQYAAEQVEIIRGPASLMYGSDAIAGIFLIRTNEVPAQNTISGSFDLTGRSNNRLAGMSASLTARRKAIYASGRITAISYGDYILPVDSVDIYSYRIALRRHSLRNTAGNETDFHLTTGIVTDHFKGHIILSSINTHAGFFANAHGLEPRNVDTQLHDQSNRDIQYPWQEAHHSKLILSGEYANEKFRMEMVFGYQNNLRNEWSPYVSHGFMPPRFPDNMPFPEDLERKFNKNVLTGQTNLLYSSGSKWSLACGFNGELQDNTIGGWSMIIPSFHQKTLGGFVLTKGKLWEQLQVTGGIRYDAGLLNTRAYYDWFSTPVVSASNDTSYVHVLRAPQLSRKFQSISGSIGMVATREHTRYKLNIGKGFRMPLAQEVASNGVNYHHFSFEKGDTSIRSETSWQVDLGIEISLPRFAIEIAPFINYFPNFIFLNPTFHHDYFYGAGNQIFEYTQSEVLRAGGEAHLHYVLSRHLKAGFIAEFVYSEQLSGPKKGFCLPFSPPASFLMNLQITPNNKKVFYESYLSADAVFAAAQNNIVPPEIKTPGYFTLNLSAGTVFIFRKFRIETDIQIQNLLNAKYFQHTSYYRKIGVPEPGRNGTIHFHIPINK